MRILITGGTGFIGTPLVKKLAENNEILLLVPPQENIPQSEKTKFVKGDLSNIEVWKQEVINFRPDTTIHMAWQGIPDYGPETSIKNLNYGLNLIKMLTETTCKHIIATGSCWEYGKDLGELTEEDSIKPLNPFSASKNALNQLGREIAKENNITFTWTRIFYAYGPGQKEASLIPYLINNIKNNQVPDIKTPKTRNDFIFVEDISEAIISLVNNPKEGTYNIGTGKSTSVEKIINLICNHYNFKYNLENKPQEKNIDFWANISKIRQDTNWTPKTSIQEGIQKFINHYEIQKNKMAEYDNLPSLREHVTGEKNKDTEALNKAAEEWVKVSAKNKLAYEVDWLGVPIIQTAEDMILMQELIFKLKPDIILETGIAHGGSLIYYASLLELLGKGRVIGVDVDIREHNRKVMEAHPLYKRIDMIEADSIAEETIQKIKNMIPDGAKVLVCLDSMHTKDHVLKELKLYQQFVKPGSYIVVCDTHTSRMVELGVAGEEYRNNSPREAVDEFLQETDDFEVDKEYNKLYTSYAPDGYLKRVK